MSDETTPITPPEHHRHQSEPPARNTTKTVVIVIGAIVGVALIALVLWLLFGRGTPAPEPTPTPTPTESPPPTPTPTPTPTVEACAPGDTGVTLGEPDTAAGTTRVPLIFTNTGSVACTVEGYPVVSFVGDDQTTPIGAPSTDDSSTSPVQLITIEPGNAASSILSITTAGNVCDPVAAAGFSVALPGGGAPIFVATTDYEACDAPNTALLKASAIDTN